jgi:putative ABC transport system ATP-binding protein
MTAPALQFDAVSKMFPRDGGGGRVALKEVSLTVAAGSTVAVVGRSGSGKSTLLNLAAGIDLPTGGRVLLEGRDLASLSEKERTLLRRKSVGLIFQFFHLLPHLTVEDNVALPEWIAGQTSATALPRIHRLLERVGLADRSGDPVQQLSGGEMQRVAICRALVRRPRLLLADEPTGSLDDENSRQIMDRLLALAREEGSTLIFVTHSRELASLADEVLVLKSGMLVPS